MDWVEGGVYDAIKRGYLKNLFFGISTDPEGTQLLEVGGLVCVARACDVWGRFADVGQPH